MKHLAAMLFSITAILSAESTTANAEGDVWQQNALFQPSPWQLEAERNGRVVIYHHLTDTEVKRALDTQFERIQAMMFTGIVITEADGRPAQDPDTGEELVEDDGCD